jgi:hypothetical protein
MLSGLTYLNIEKAYVAKDYKFYTDIFDLNIFGIRAATPVVNTFCDILGVAYVTNDNQSQLFIGAGTTDPGLLYLKNPENVAGTFIMKEGYTHSLWTPGDFKGMYTALVQFSEVTGYRDGNRDGNLDLVPGQEVTGKFGICTHPAAVSLVAPAHDPVTVGPWSAGCQVWQSVKAFISLMRLVSLQIKYGHGNKFSYALFNEKDIQLA